MEANRSTNISNVLIFNTNATKPPSNLPPSTVIPWLAVYMTQCYGGALCNLSVACLILSSPRLRTGCGLLIAHGLIAHSVLCSISFPLTSIPIYYRLVLNWTIEFRYCNVAMWSQLACRYASNWIETYLAANRLVALCFPFHYRKFSREKVENSVMVILWICAACLAGLGCFGLGVHYFVLPNGFCSIGQKNVFGLLTIITGNYIPLCIAAAQYVIVYLKILAKKRRKNALVYHSNESTERTAERRRLNKANMVFVSFFWNCLCYMVWPITLTMLPHVIQIPIVPLVFGNVQIMGYVTNPLVFFIMSADYRSELRRICQAARNRTKQYRKRPTAPENTLALAQVPSGSNSRRTVETGSSGNI